MAELITKTRTNYFKVTDVDAFIRFINDLVADDAVEVFRDDEDPELLGFSCADIIYGVGPASGEDENEFGDMNYGKMAAEMASRMQKIIAPGHACIIMSISHEKLRSLDGMATIITETGSRTVFLENTALCEARHMLGDDSYSPKMSY